MAKKLLLAVCCWMCLSPMKISSSTGKSGGKFDDIPFEETCYRQGWAAYFSGDTQTARNWWYKYLTLRRRHAGFQPDFHYDRTAAEFHQVDLALRENIRIVKIPDKSLPAPEMGALSMPPASAPPQVSRKKKKTSTEKKTLPTSPRKPAMSAEQFLERAKREQEAGRYEQARDMLDIALRLNPRYEPALRAREQLQALMEQ